MAWKIIQLPKAFGGLNVGNLYHRNLALLFKWLWRFLNEPDSLWKQLVQTKYKYGAAFTLAKLSPPKSGGPWRNIITALFRNEAAKNLTLHNTRKQVGAGSHTLFWEDLWVGDSTLANQFPRLFRLNSNPHGMVDSFGFWEGKKWLWSFNWKREFRPMDVDEWLKLQLLLDRVVFNPHQPDSYVWAPHKCGIFSVKSFTYELAKSDPTSHQTHFKSLWRGLVPHRIELFSWFAILNKLNTRSKLVKLGVIPLSEAQCVLCGSALECTNHLFIHCSLARNLWEWWAGIWNFHWVPPLELQDLYAQWSPPFKGIFFKKVWLAIFPIILWSLWKERNARIFQNSPSSLSQIKDLILLRLS